MLAIKVLALLASVGAADELHTKNQIGSVFQDCAFCPELVVIPAGRSHIGADDAEHVQHQVPILMNGAMNIPQWEQPRTEIHLKRAFAIGRHEVTIGEYRAFTKATGYAPTPGCSDPWATDGALPTWQDPGYPVTDGYPVACVSWIDAAAYTAWLAGVTGEAYRLPSEAEWQHAARAGTSSARYTDEMDGSFCLYENGPDASHAKAFPEQVGSARLGDGPTHFECDDGYATLAPAGAFRPNPFNVQDTIGSLREHVQDCVTTSHEGAPTDGTAWEGAFCAEQVTFDVPGGYRFHSRTLKAGSWSYPPYGHRAARRSTYPMALKSVNVGFRVARDLAP